MKYRLLDLLACPMCKQFPLKLFVFEERQYERKLPLEKPFCELFCGLKSAMLKDLKEDVPCEECIKREVVTGVLYCSRCGRWYPIIDEIPRMLPDNLRREEEDRAFLERFRTKIPRNILEEGKPFSLKG